MRPAAALLALALAGLSTAQTHFSVQVVGRGKPIILIPGLTCSGNVWDATVEKLKSHYQCHVLTLAGFAGQPPVPGPILEPVRDEIIAYVKAKHLSHPAVIGHSLGGFMVFSLASKEPDLFGPLIAVDGVPWLAILTNPGTTPASAKQVGDYLAKMMSGFTPEKFQASTLAAIKTEVTAQADIDRVYADSKKTDPATAGEAMKEMMVTDLRDEVAKIKSPVLLFAAGSWATSPEQKTMLEKMYQAQVAKVPNARVVPVWNAKHFVMLDNPTVFMSETEKFLKENWKG